MKLCVTGVVKRLVRSLVDLLGNLLTTFFASWSCLELANQMIHFPQVTEETVTNHGTGEEVVVSLKYQKMLSHGDQETLVHYNVLLRRVMHSLKMVQVRDNFYLPGKAKRLPAHQ